MPCKIIDKLAFLFVWVLIIYTFTSEGNSQTIPGANAPFCGPHDVMIEAYNETYSEIPIGRGKTNTGNMMEILADEESGTWTVFITSRNGHTCIVSAGKNLEMQEFKQLEGDDGA